MYELSQKDIAVLTGMSLKSVMRAIVKLENEGLVTVIKKQGECNFYSLEPIPIIDEQKSGEE